MEPSEVPRSMTIEGREWQKDSYGFEVEFGWKTPFRDDEYDWDPEEVDFNILGGDVPHYFVFIQEQPDESYTVELSSTNGPDYHRSGMAERLGGKDGGTTDSLEDAVTLAKSLMKRVA